MRSKLSSTARAAKELSAANKRAAKAKRRRPDDEPIPTMRQESILATLAFKNKAGAEIAPLVSPNNFDDLYRPIAKAVLDYWDRYDRPPGRKLFPALFSRELKDEQKSRALRTLLMRIDACGEDLNTKFVRDQLSAFLQKQALKAAIIRAGDAFEAHQNGEDETLVTNVSDILSKALAAVPGCTKDTGTMSISDFTDLNLPPPRRLLHPWLEDGACVLVHAPPGQLKTLLLMHVAHALASGEHALKNKWIIRRPVKALFVDGELPPNRFLRRWSRFETKPDNLFVLSVRYARSMGITYQSLYTKEGRAQLDRAIEASDAQVIILDSIFTLFGAVSEKELDQWFAVNAWLQPHMDAGRSFILVHHDTKNTAGNPYGTVLRQVLADTEIAISQYKDAPDADPDEHVLLVEYKKHREFSSSEAEPFLLYAKVTREEGELDDLDPQERYSWRWAPKPQRSPANSKSARVMAMLRAGKKTQAIMDETGASKGLVSQLRAKLHESH